MKKNPICVLCEICGSIACPIRLQIRWLKLSGKRMRRVIDETSLLCLDNLRLRLPFWM